MRSSKAFVSKSEVHTSLSAKPRILLVSHDGGSICADRSLFTLAKELAAKCYPIVVSSPRKAMLWQELQKRNIDTILLRTISSVVARPCLIRGLLRLPLQFLNICRIIHIIKTRRFDLVHCNSIALPGRPPWPQNYYAFRLLCIPVNI